MQHTATIPAFNTLQLTRAQADNLLRDAINMYLEYRDQHAHPDDTDADHRDRAVTEILAGLDAEADLIAHGDMTPVPGRTFPKPVTAVSLFDICNAIAMEDTQDGICTCPDLLDWQRNKSGAKAIVGVPAFVADWLDAGTHKSALIVFKKADFRRIQAKLESTHQQ